MSVPRICAQNTGAKKRINSRNYCYRAHKGVSNEYPSGENVLQLNDNILSLMQSMFYAQVYDDLQSALDIENDCDNGDLVSRDGAQVRGNLNAQPMYRPPSSFTKKIHTVVGAVLFTIHGSVASAQAGPATSVWRGLEHARW